MPLNVGIIGTGNIAPAYLKGCSYFPEDIRVTACADIDMPKVQAFADKHGLKAMSVDDLLGQPDIDIIINLTVPAAHAAVSQQILAAGKHPYAEKPFALNRADGKAVLDAAAARGLKVGCAPDTFLGAGGQTARKTLDSGAIGAAASAVAIMASNGPQGWHPNPFFYFIPGGGPVFDMAPYYLTALINLFGSVTHVSAMAKRAVDERVAGHEAIRGQKIPVSVDTHTAGTLRFENGVVATVIFSFDIWAHNLPRIEVYGTTSSMTVPDPNTFGGDVQVFDVEGRAWQTVPSVGRADVQRGIGVADMARAIRDGGAHRASGELAYHVLDTMVALDEAAAHGQTIALTSHVDRPAALEA